VKPGPPDEDNDDRQLDPYFSFRGNAREAITFYQDPRPDRAGPSPLLAEQPSATVSVAEPAARFLGDMCSRPRG
jgi:hypothetical protein